MNSDILNEVIVRQTWEQVVTYRPAELKAFRPLVEARRLETLAIACRRLAEQEGIAPVEYEADREAKIRMLADANDAGRIAEQRKEAEETARRQEIAELLGRSISVIERIKTLTVAYVGADPAEVYGASRRKSTTAAKARALACQLLRDNGMSYSEIARALGFKNHTTIITACRRAEASFAADLGELRGFLK